MLVLLVCGGAKKGPPLPAVTEMQPLGKWMQGTLPLTVVVVPELHHYEQQIQGAMDWWNTRLGREVFLRLYEIRDGGIVIIGSCDTKDSPCFPPDAGRGKMVTGRGGYARTAHVWIRQSLDHPERTAAHELGHALGLQHICVEVKDRGPDTPAFQPTCGPTHPKSAVMYPKLSNGDYYLTDTDRAMLRQTLPP